MGLSAQHETESHVSAVFQVEIFNHAELVLAGRSEMSLHTIAVGRRVTTYSNTAATSSDSFESVVYLTAGRAGVSTEEGFRAVLALGPRDRNHGFIG